MASSIEKEVAMEYLPVLRIYKDGTVERLMNTPYAPPSPEGHPTTGVSSKDISLSPHLSARLYLPPSPTPKKLSILVYFHGGGFCFESSFGTLHHTYINHLVSKAKVICISVEYRLAPEHPLPAAYQDCWNATQWVANANANPKDPWLINYADFSKLFIGGDSAGGNIVNYVLLRAAKEELEGGLKIAGGIIGHPYFWGSQVMGSEASKYKDRESSLPTICWNLSYPTAVGGLDNAMLNPVGAEVDRACLADLACSRLLVNVAEKDELRDRGVEYYHAVKGSGWGGQIELFEDMGEPHYFHMDYPNSDKTKAMVERVAKFIMKVAGNSGSTGSTVSSI